MKESLVKEIEYTRYNKQNKGLSSSAIAALQQQALPNLIILHSVVNSQPFIYFQVSANGIGT
jgi:hypothetical protein